MKSQIRLTRVVLENFKGVHSGQFSFGENVTVVAAANGKGKTTIVDAVMWCLFGIDSHGRSKFGLKTRDENGNEIREIPHSVEVHLSVDGMDYIFKRSIQESVSRDGAIKNTFIYNVGGESVTAGDYAKMVDKICRVDVFQICSLPGFFTSMKWEKQRSLLVGMIDDVKEEDIIGKDKQLAVIAEEVKSRGSIEKVLKHYSYVRNEVVGKLEDIPVRLSELNGTLPEKQDWDDIEERIRETNKKCDALRSDIAKSMAGGADDIRMASVRKKLDFARKRIDNMEKSMRNQASEDSAQYNDELHNATRLVSDTEEFLLELKHKESSINELISRCQESLKRKEEEKEDGSKEWAEIKGLAWTWNEDDNVCPTCGQAYPQDKLDEMMQTSKYNFNTKVEKRKQDCIKKAAEIKDAIKDINVNIDAYKGELYSVTMQIDNAEKVLSERKAHKDAVSKEQPKTYQQLLAENENYKQVLAEISSLEEELEKPSDDNDKSLVNELNRKLTEIQQQSYQLQHINSDRMTYERISKRIEEVKDERKTLQEQLDKIERMLDNATRYNVTCCKIMEERINARFSYVQWSLFRYNLDGTPNPYCECSHEGVPFSDLNTAAQINAGIDICNVISKYYEVFVPMFVDGAESVNNVKYDGGQQIRLTVSLDDKLKFSFREN